MEIPMPKVTCKEGSIKVKRNDVSKKRKKKRRPKDSTAWRGDLHYKKNGDAHPSLANAMLVFAHDPRWAGVLAYDEFVGDIVTRKLPPWPKHFRPAKFTIGDWTENDVTAAAAWLDTEYEMRGVSTRTAGQALKVISAKTIVHPVREYLSSLNWDGERRLDTWLCRIVGSEDTPYVRAVAKNFLIGAVARIYNPGAQVDSMPIFEGKQGVRKTSMLRILFSEDWFMSFSATIGDKDSYQVLLKKWGVEFGELDALSRAEVNRVKQYITERTSRYRPSYAAKASDFPRQCVFAGTTNKDQYLRDVTGGRRFWPVVVPGVKLPDGSVGIDLDSLTKERDQLWSEAVVRYKKGEAWHFTDVALVRAAETEAKHRQEADIWREPVAAWLTESEKGASRRRRGVTTHEVFVGALGGLVADLKRSDEMRIADLLRGLGWESARETRAGCTTRVFRPTNEAALSLVLPPKSVRGVQAKGRKRA
jgi:putative DNA primase/helicase